MINVRIKSVVRNSVEKSDGAARPFIGLEDLAAGTGRAVVEQFPPKEAEDSVVHRPGDVLFSKLRPYLAKSFLPQREGTATGELLVLRPGERVDPRFLFYVSLSRPWVEWANTTAYGSKMPRTSWELLAEYRMWLPGKDEQKRVADFLDSETSLIDRLTERMEEQNRLLASRRKSLLGLTWSSGSKVVRLGYSLRLVTSGPRGWSDYESPNGALFFRSANLRRDSTEPNLNSVICVAPSRSAAAEAARSRVEAGDVLVGITGANTGWVTLAGDEVVGAHVSQHVCLVRPFPYVSGKWLAYLLSSPIIQDELLGSQYGGTKTQLSLPDFRNLRIPIPSLEEQERVAHGIQLEIEVLEQEREKRREQLTLLAERRQALITAAVTGQLDVTTACPTYDRDLGGDSDERRPRVHREGI